MSESCWTESCVPTLTERRSSRAGGSPAVLCVISIAVSFLVVSLPRVRGNMATPAAVNPSGKSVPGVAFFGDVFYPTFGLSEPSVFVRGCCGGGLKRSEAATGRRSLAASIHPPSPTEPLLCSQRGVYFPHFAVN